MSASAPVPGSERVTTATFRASKSAGDPIVVVTAYDSPGARLVDEAGVDAILVGDSMGMVVLGHADTLSVSMDDMVRATAAVARGAERAMVVADMPFMSFQVSVEDALRNAGRLLSEGHAAAVKLEGGRRVAPIVRRMVEAGIPVMGHVGLTPQSVNQLGGYRTQAADASEAVTLLDDCRALEEAGAFAVVLECIPAELAAIVTEQIGIPTIGIGAGPDCDGQVQVYHDLLGLGSFTPRHAKQYVDVGEAIRDAVGRYVADVREGAFPSEEHLRHMDVRELAELDDTRNAPAGSAGGE